MLVVKIFFFLIQRAIWTFEILLQNKVRNYEYTAMKINLGGEEGGGGGGGRDKGETRWENWHLWNVACNFVLRGIYGTVAKHEVLTKESGLGGKEGKRSC